VSEYFTSSRIGNQKRKEALHRAKLNRSIIININNRNNKKGKQK